MIDPLVVLSMDRELRVSIAIDGMIRTTGLLGDFSGYPFGNDNLSCMICG
jgi:hypothetical protein